MTTWGTTTEKGVPLKLRALLLFLAGLPLAAPVTPAVANALAARPAKVHETAVLKLPSGDVTNVKKYPGGKSVDLTKVIGYRKGKNVVVVLRARNVKAPDPNPGLQGEKDTQSWCVQLYNTGSTVQSFCGGLGQDNLQSNSTLNDNEWGGGCVHGDATWSLAASTKTEKITFTVPVSCFPKRGAWGATAQSHFYAGYAGVPTNTDDAHHKWTAMFSDTAGH